MAVRIACDTVVLVTARSDAWVRRTVARNSGTPDWPEFDTSAIPGVRLRRASYWSAIRPSTSGSGPRIRTLTFPPPPPPPPNAAGRLVPTVTSGNPAPSERSSVWISQTVRDRVPRSTSSIAKLLERPPPPPYPPPPPPTEVNTDFTSGKRFLSMTMLSTCCVTRSVASRVAPGGIRRDIEIWFSSSSGAYSEPTKLP